jgi:hypothetical protein
MIQIPGLAGKLSDCTNSVLCAPYLPHIAHRNWAFTRNEAVKKDANGKYDIVNLIGADKIDACNYRAGVGAMRALFAAAAAEFGDYELRDAMLEQLDTEHHPVFTSSTGALHNKGLSTGMSGGALRARFCGYQDWVKLVTEGPPANVLKGPVLEEVSFPEVLVAKAYSHDGLSLDLVLYPGREPGVFPLGFKHLRPGETYDLGAQSVTAKSDGTAQFEARIDGRTALQLILRQLN